MSMVREIAAEGMLPSQNVLLAQLQQDEASVIDISECQQVSLEDVPEAEVPARMRLKRKVSDMRGSRGDVPEDIWKEASAMMADGRLPFTTSAQRERSRMTPNTEYGTPPSLFKFLAHGFIHPNLPPPKDLSWKCVPGKWWLSFVRGG